MVARSARRRYFWQPESPPGWSLARAHARSGDPIAMTGYLGRDDAFGRSVIDFCERYADRNEQDYEEFVKAIRSGRLQAVEGV